MKRIGKEHSSKCFFFFNCLFAASCSNLILDVSSTNMVKHCNIGKFLIHENRKKTTATTLNYISLLFWKSLFLHALYKYIHIYNIPFEKFHNLLLLGGRYTTVYNMRRLIKRNHIPETWRKTSSQFVLSHVVNYISQQKYIRRRRRYESVRGRGLMGRNDNNDAGCRLV